MSQVKSVLNVFAEKSKARDALTGQFRFIYPRQPRKIKLAEDLIIYDQVILSTTHFNELSWISTWLPFSVLSELLKTGAIKLVWDPLFLTSSSAVAFISIYEKPQELIASQVFGGRILDVLGLPKTIPDKVIKSFLEFSPYEKQETYKIADIAGQFAAEATEQYIQAASDSAKTDLSNPEFISSCYEALTGRRFDRIGITLYNNVYNNVNIQIANFDSHVILANIYLAIMAEHGASYLRSPQIIQKIVAHKSRWLGKKLSSTEEVLKNLSTVYKVAGVPNIRELLRQGIINERNLLELRTAAEEFRAWFHAIVDSQQVLGNDDNAVLREYIKSLEKSTAVDSLPLKTLRFAITSGVGLIPGIGNIASIGLSAFDTFFLEKLAVGWQPKIFLDRLRNLGKDHTADNKLYPE